MIEVSGVGEAEIPLMRVLYETIFGEVAEELEVGSEDILVIAHLEGNPLGFGIGSVSGVVIKVRLCGVMKEYQRQGIGGRIVAMVAGEGRMRGGEVVEMEAGEGCEAMVELGRSLGFEETADGGRVRFRKVLTTG